MASFSLPGLIDHSGWGPVPAALSVSSSAIASAAASSSAAAAAASDADSADESEQVAAAMRAVPSYAPVPAGAFQFAELPFQPFNKNDKLFRVSDWAAKNEDQYKRNWPRHDGSLGVGIIGDDGITVDDADGAFSLVDNKTKLKPKYGKTTFKRGMMQAASSSAGGQRRGGGARTGTASFGRGGGGRRVASTRTGGSNNPNNKRMGGGGGRNQRMPQRNFADRVDLKEPSVIIDEEWPLVQDIDLVQLGNYVADVDDAEDIQFAGTLEPVNPKFAHITPKNPVSLNRYENKQHFTATTSNDPIIEQLKKENAGNVYATDVILSALMACPRSVNSWDVIIRKEGSNLIFDKRPTSRLDFVSVNENMSAEQMNVSASDKENVNHPDNLSMEATLINHNYAQQLLSVPAGAEKPLPHNFDSPNPFLNSLNKGQEPASVAFRYRKFQLPGGIKLISRCSLNGFIEKKNEKSYILAKSLNEFDSKLQGNIDWRQKLESQSGSVLAAEMKNNQYKLGRWVSECVLSGADELRLGFVSRLNPKNNHKHAILMSKTYTIQTFADSVNVFPRKLWGTLTQLISIIKKMDDGSYCLLRDPQKPILHVYSIPKDAFENELEDLEEETEM